MAKQQTCQRYVFKIHSRRIRESKWELRLSLADARRNSEIISLIDSQVLRWINEINNNTDIDERAKVIQKELKKIKSLPYSVKNKNRIKQLYSDLDNVQFYPDYMCLIIDSKSDFDYVNKHGFVINNIKYKRLLGTNGGIKCSTIVYVSERVYDILNKRINNGRNESVPLVPAKLESYKALTCSGSIPVSQPKGVLVVNDCITHFKSDIIKIDDNTDGEPLLTYENNQDIELNNSDGYGLIDPELSEQWHKELMCEGVCTGFCIRNSWCKGMVFTFPFKEFAKEIAHNNVVKDAWGNDIDINSVQLILTVSMLKLWNCYSSYDDYAKNCKENHYTYSVTKCCPDELENERNLNYQFLQSYRLNDEQIKELLSPTVNEIKDVLGGDYRKSILFLKGMYLNENNVKYIDNDFVKALMIDSRLINDSFVKSKIHQIIKKRIKEAKIGTIKFHANYSIISGDPYSLCQSMFGMEITGLLKSCELYNKYWVDHKADKVVCFRAPMSCHNNIRLLNVVNNSDIEKWYRYMTTCTILNSWDTTTFALSGADFDSDACFVSSNKILIENYRNLDTIICLQRKADKKVVTEKDIEETNYKGMRAKIGQITNRITTMMDVQSYYSEDSIEFKTLDYRIMCGQLYQQAEIDKIKGVLTKPMPIYWYNMRNANKESENYELNKRIVADKKPRFMAYIYPQMMKEYNDYVSNTDYKCRMLFRLSVSELKAKENKTKDEIKFLEYFDKYMPVGVGNCLMNRICKQVESEFDNCKISNNNKDFDMSIIKPVVKYTKAQYKNIEDIYNKYNKDMSDYLTLYSNAKVTTEEYESQRIEFKEKFKRMCIESCPNENQLCAIIIDMCYKSNKNKQFVWDIYGDVIVKHLLELNHGIISYPEMCENGDIVYSGCRFKMRQQRIDDTI